MENEDVEPSMLGHREREKFSQSKMIEHAHLYLIKNFNIYKVMHKIYNDKIAYISE